MSEDILNIYWAPQTSWEINGEEDWNMLYPEPTNLFSELQKIKTKDAGSANYFSCPATSQKFKNTFIFRNSVASAYEFDFTEGYENKIIFPVTDNYIGYDIKRPPTINIGPLIHLNMTYAFFSEEPVLGVFTPPLMHEPKYTKYGTVVPGEFDVGQWFRPYNLEIQMWNMEGQFVLEEDEPIFYVQFKTDKKINLQRFKWNGALNSYLKACGGDTQRFGSGIPLSKRYKRFNDSKMRELVLKEIKANIL
jgi:hypothetical protein